MAEQDGSEFREGDRVRIIADPARAGSVRAGVRMRGSLRLLQVGFSDGTQYLPEDQLELVPALPDDPLDLFSKRRFSVIDDLRRAMVRVRLTGRLANMLYSLDATNTDFYAYQFKPIVKLLQSPATGILIADEVGLGKTIEAGLIWTELRSRFDAKRLLVVCPSFLRTKWQEELKLRFGVSSQCVSAREATEKVVDQLSRRGPDDGFALIGSLQGLRPPSGWEEAPENDPEPRTAFARLLERHASTDPLFDLVIIDEAHYLRNPDSQTAELGRLLRRTAEHIVLLSATPVHLKSDDLYNLLRIIDEDNFSQPAIFRAVLEANAPLLRARDLVHGGRCGAAELHRHLREAADNPILRENQQLRRLLADAPTDAALTQPAYRSELARKLESINLLGYAVTRTRKREVHENRVARVPHDESVPLTKPEAEFYDAVTHAVRDACSRAAGGAGFMLTTPQRQMSSSMAAALRAWQREQREADRMLEDSNLEDITDEDTQPTPAQTTLVSQLVAQFSGASAYRELRDHDSKYERFREIISNFLREHRGEKVVVFSYFRETLAYLAERLAEDRVPAVLLRGGDNKEEVLRSFRDPSGPAVLLSSEVGSEGIDLQFSRFLVNYDLPWNPMRLEQRIGRIDRLGQAAKRIEIWNLFHADTIDARIYARLSQRLLIAEDSLGALEPILAADIKKLVFDLLSGNLTPEQERSRIEQTSQAFENKQKDEEELERQAAHLVRYGDYILEQVKAARELSRKVTGDDLEEFVVGHLKQHFPGCRFSRIANVPNGYSIAMSNEAKFEFGEYLAREPRRQPTVFAHPDTRPAECYFTGSVVGVRRNGMEAINQLHPLVRWITSRLTGSPTEAHRPAICGTVRSSDLEKPMKPGLYAFSIQHWAIKGVTSLEQLHFEGTRLVNEVGKQSEDIVLPDDMERLIVRGSAQAQDWRDEPASHIESAAKTINEQCLARSQDAYDRFVEEIRVANEDRANVMEASISNHLMLQTEKYRALAERHRLHEREGLAKAAEAKLRSIEEHAERRRLKIREQRTMEHSFTDIAVGLMRVEP